MTNPVVIIQCFDQNCVQVMFIQYRWYWVVTLMEPSSLCSGKCVWPPAANPPRNIQIVLAIYFLITSPTSEPINVIVSSSVLPLCLWPNCINNNIDMITWKQSGQTCTRHRVYPILLLTIILQLSLFWSHKWWWQKWYNFCIVSSYQNHNRPHNLLILCWICKKRLS